MEYVTLKNINKTYGDYQASTDVSFSIEKGKLDRAVPEKRPFSG